MADQNENRYISLVRSNLTSAINYVKWLDDNGQIDRDAHGEPIVLQFAQEGEDGVIRVHFQRNNLKHNSVLPKRSRPGADGKPKVLSTTLSDFGDWKRSDPPLQAVSQPESKPSERPKRVQETNWLALAKRLSGA